MTYTDKKRTEKLYILLNGLLVIDMVSSAYLQVNIKVTIEFLCEALHLDYEKWEMLSLKNELISEGHILETNGELRITETGKIFVNRHKRLENLTKSQKEAELILEKTKEKFKYDKFSFWLSILAIIIAGFSFLMTILKQ